MPGGAPAERRVAAGGSTDPAVPPGLEPAESLGPDDRKVTSALDRLEAMIGAGDDARVPTAASEPGRTPEAVPPTKPIAPPPGRADSPATGGSAPGRPDIRGAMEMPLAELSLNGLPWWRLPPLVYQLTGVPLSLDADAFAARSLSLEAPIDGDWKGTTVGTVLSEVAKRHGLVVIAEEHAVRLTVPRAARLRVRLLVTGFPPAELTEGDAKVMLGGLAGLDASAMDEVAVRRDGAAWHVEAPAWVVRRVRAVEAALAWYLAGRRARAAEGLPEAAAAERSAVAAARAGEAPWPTVHASFFAPVAISEALDFVCRSTGYVWCADWESLAPIRLKPGSRVALIFGQGPLPTFLDKLLHERRAAFLLAAPKTLVILGVPPSTGKDGLSVHGVRGAAGPLRRTDIERRLAKIGAAGSASWCYLPKWSAVIVRADAKTQALVGRALAPAGDPPAREVPAKEE